MKRPNWKERTIRLTGLIIVLWALFDLLREHRLLGF
jgi:hypothetical protein